MTRPVSPHHRLADVAPHLERVLTHGSLGAARFGVHEIRLETRFLAMRDGVRLATDLYRPPPAQSPAIVMRTPYGRAQDKFVGAFMALARRGYLVISQDCRGTGSSEPDVWDYYVYESEDSYDLMEWVKTQSWFDGFAGACGGSYVGQTQWCLGVHSATSTVVPEVSGLGAAINTAHLHMFVNAFARSVGKGRGKGTVPLDQLEAQMLPETLGSGYFNESLYSPLLETLAGKFLPLQPLAPSDRQHWLWVKYCNYTCAERAAFIKDVFGTDCVSIQEAESLSSIFGQTISHDRLTLPTTDLDALARSLKSPALMITGWYDWGLNDALATWQLIMQQALETVRDRSRLIITPSAHNAPGYHEGGEQHPELRRAHRTENQVALLLRWYEALRQQALDTWPKVIYYLMGANTWCTAEQWPPEGSRPVRLYLSSAGGLIGRPPTLASASQQFTYDPLRPTPTVGGSILSHVYPAGSVDVSGVQCRADVLTFTTAPLETDLDLVGSVKVTLYASSSAVDTDFCARLSEVFPDGRAIQLQAGILRARFRESKPVFLEPGRVYPLQIDLLATANRFSRGNRLRLDLSSSDFPRFDRNTNRGGEVGEPMPALQTIYFDRDHPSHLLIHVLGNGSLPD